jgi:hypothetical protein
MSFDYVKHFLSESTEVGIKFASFVSVAFIIIQIIRGKLLDLSGKNQK